MSVLRASRVSAPSHQALVTLSLGVQQRSLCCLPPLRLLLHCLLLRSANAHQWAITCRACAGMFPCTETHARTCSARQRAISCSASCSSARSPCSSSCSRLASALCSAWGNGAQQHRASAATRAAAATCKRATSRLCSTRAAFTYWSSTACICDFSRSAEPQRRRSRDAHGAAAVTHQAPHHALPPPLEHMPPTGAPPPVPGTPYWG